MGRRSGVAWHGLWFWLSRLCCLLRMKKLLEFNFSAVVAREIEDGTAKIGAAKDEVSDEQTVKCEVDDAS
ncbi:pentatricopeptide repeat-containing protein [Pyrus ussuriensis x Pyrus communis]|uniref:Pentatricopeptide repeat-containing protein n=1 Tax=Pyrus ussuriensis x Pyrus communis TaxID=2448454 RepID=A0A5N5GZL1_9ROSA|nr:pentatricopeptide repeat-containing protein [Pyrus ussuriensis x Pyrus communis]